MTIFSSRSVGLLCRPVKHKLVFGKALSYVPPNTHASYSFKIMRMEPIIHTAGKGSVQYKLVETDGPPVDATNTGKYFVNQGSNVVLLEYLGVTSGEKLYDVYCDCGSGRFGVVIEPSLGMQYPLVQPNFTGCDDSGTSYTLDDFLRNSACSNGRCAGSLAILDEEYYPLRAKYQGGESYIDTETGKKEHRTSGEEQFEYTYDSEGMVSSYPLYYMRRELVLDEETYYYKKREYANGTTGDIPTYLNSPYLYQYIDGTDCAFSMPPVFNLAISANASRENWQARTWKVTRDPNMAQLNYDLFLCPKQAENESIMPGSIVEIIKETIVENYLPARLSDWGIQLDEYGETIATTVNVPYCLVEPPISNWFAAIDGQVQTHGVRYTRNQEVRTREDYVCSILKEYVGLTPDELLDGLPDSVVPMLVGDLERQTQVGWTSDYVTRETLNLFAVMFVICDTLRYANPGMTLFFSNGMLTNEDMPTKMGIDVYNALYSKTEIVCDEIVPIYMFAWLKYVLHTQMSVLEKKDDYVPPISIMVADNFTTLHDHMIYKTAQLLSCDFIAVHPPGQEIVILNKSCDLEEGQSDPELMVKCLLKKSLEQSLSDGTFNVQHNPGVSGEPAFISKDMIVNRRTWQPCRGCFTVLNAELVKFPNLFRILCQNGFGVQTRVHDPMNTLNNAPMHYMIERVLVDNVHQRYDLVLRTTLKYKSYGELMSFAWN
jgi:hypothetical protein